MVCILFGELYIMRYTDDVKLLARIIFGNLKARRDQRRTICLLCKVRLNQRQISVTVFRVLTVTELWEHATAEEQHVYYRNNYGRFAWHRSC